MRRYLYSFIELFSYMGDNTPENPGGDFGMSVWIEAETVEEARSWGKRVLEEFVRARFRQSQPDVDASRYEGAIEEDVGVLERYLSESVPVCRVGKIPRWTEPWKHCMAVGEPRKVLLGE